jgi:3D (Asp-Asp-Asp) domain-containing protein
MTKQQRTITRFLTAFTIAGFFIDGFGGASIEDFPAFKKSQVLSFDEKGSLLLLDLKRLGLLQHTSQEDLEKFLRLNREKNKSAASLLKDPYWIEKFGLEAKSFKATWYASNPYDLLPRDLQKAIHDKKIPKLPQQKLIKWLKENKSPESWIQALNAALTETTPDNLWRAAYGKKPFAKNGQFLKPIVVDQGDGQFLVQDGHIATDPKIIPTNSSVLLVVKIKGQDRIIKVKAADIGGAIKGHHVDLPIHTTPKSSRISSASKITFPRESIGNPSVLILVPSRQKTSLNPKA